MVSLIERIEELQKKNEQIVIWTGETKHQGYIKTMYENHFEMFVPAKRRLRTIPIDKVTFIEHGYMEKDEYSSYIQKYEASKG